MHSPILTAILFFLPAVTYSACAMEAERVDSEFVDKQFRCEFVALLDAPVAAVEAVLRDYDSYPKLDRRILEAKVIERPSSTTATLQTTLRACFGPFCRRVRRVEVVEETPNTLSAVTDPARSDVRFGETHTVIEAVSSTQTRVIYRTSITPGFWVPALGARAWMLRTLEEATTTLFENVEARAQSQ
jgi:hypothetical protein